MVEPLSAPPLLAELLQIVASSPSPDALRASAAHAAAQLLRLRPLLASSVLSESRLGCISLYLGYISTVSRLYLTSACSSARASASLSDLRARSSRDLAEI